VLFRSVDTFTFNDISRAIQSDGKYTRTSQRMSVQRQITVSTSIRLTNAMTGVVQSSFSAPKSQTDKSRPGLFVGENMAEADLPAGAVVIENLLEEQVIQFVGEVVGTHKRGEPERISASANPDCRAGVRYLESESWSAALDAFERAIAADPGDHRALFGAGVACEMTNRNDEAIKYYERAVGLSDSSAYARALRRVRSNDNG